MNQSSHQSIDVFLGTTLDFSRFRSAVIDLAVMLKVEGALVSPEEYQIINPGCPPFQLALKPIYVNGCSAAEGRDHDFRNAVFKEENQNLTNFRMTFVRAIDEASKSGMANQYGNLHGRSLQYMLEWMDQKFLTLAVADAYGLMDRLKEFKFDLSTMTIEGYIFEVKKLYTQLNKSGIVFPEAFKCREIKEMFAKIPHMATSIELWEQAHGTIASQDFDDLCQVLVIKFNQVKNVSIANLGFAAAATAPAAVTAPSGTVVKGQQQVKGRNQPNLYYCHTCGINLEHNGWTCNKKGPNHKKHFTKPVGSGPWQLA